MERSFEHVVWRVFRLRYNIASRLHRDFGDAIHFLADKAQLDLIELSGLLRCYGAAVQGTGGQVCDRAGSLDRIAGVDRTSNGEGVTPRKACIQRIVAFKIIPVVAAGGDQTDPNSYESQISRIHSGPAPNEVSRSSDCDS